MADHPLRPAIDRSLGEPLPHRLANRTQDPPKAAEAFPPWGVCGISRRFQRLSPTSGQVPTRYSPVRHSTCRPKATAAFDLHVLGMPPAFVLSQDQTLMFTSRRPCPPETEVPGRPGAALDMEHPARISSEKTRTTLRYQYRMTPPAHPFPLFRSLFKQRPARLRAGRRLIGPAGRACQQPPRLFLIFFGPASVDSPRGRRASSQGRRFWNAACSADRPARRMGAYGLRCPVAIFRARF